MRSKVHVVNSRSAQKEDTKASSAPTSRRSLVHQALRTTKQGFNRLRGKKAVSPAAIHNESTSPLLRLPLELREKVWAYALAPADESASPHFHIYDDVYDSCTYKARSPDDREQRTKPTQMSLLLTCRAIYYEALQHLYDQTHFTLVLFAGRPRPGRSLGGEEGFRALFADEKIPGPNIAQRNRIGSLKDCKAVFARMRYVTAVIQPGSKPDTNMYTTRIASFLAAIDYGTNLRYLSLHFNFYVFMLECKNGKERFDAILNAFHVLADPLRSRVTAGKLSLSIKNSEVFDAVQFLFGPPDEHVGDSFSALRAVLYATNDPRRPNLVFTTSHCCRRRGKYGRPARDNSASRPRSKTDRAVSNIVFAGFAATWLLLLPVSLPYSVRLYRNRERDKGNRP